MRGVKRNLGSKAHSFESFCHPRAISPFLRVVSHPRCRSEISPHELGTDSVRRLNALASAFGLLGMQQALAADQAAPEAAHRPQWSVLVSFSPGQPRRSAARRLCRTRRDAAPGWKTDIGYFLSPLRALILRRLRARTDFKRNLCPARRAPNKEHLGLANQYQLGAPVRIRRRLPGPPIHCR